jgi:SAM-dependent methyltransferase
VADTTKRTFESFGYEWNTFGDVREEDAEFAQVYFADLDFTALHGRAGLDAGCGKGRYSRFLAPHLGRLVALDGSSAVVAAARNLGGMENVFVVQADLRRAPFAPATFGFISCLGVLHHLDDPRQGLHQLVELLAPGGILLVYLYSRPADAGVRAAGLAAAALLRRLTVNLPHRILKAVSSAVAVALWTVVVQPGRIGQRVGIGPLARLPMAAYRGKPFRSLELDTFDRLSAPVENRYVWEELASWFAGEGLVVDARRDEAGWFVVSHKPAAGAGA